MSHDQEQARINNAIKACTAITHPASRAAGFESPVYLNCLAEMTK